MAAPLVLMVASVCQWTFDLLAIPTVVPGFDIPSWPTFSFARDRAINDYLVASAGAGPAESQSFEPLAALAV